MAVDNNRAPGIATLVGRLARTIVGAVQNRFELVALEWQEERTRLADLLVWLVGLLFLGMMGALLLTAVIIFLFPQDLRLYVAAGFTILYLAGAFVAWLEVRSMLRREPFSESVDQARRDQAWLKSFD
jgi:uncharacterized membrane protein YqjE